MLAQVRDFIDGDDAPPALDPIGIFLRAMRGRERKVAVMTAVTALLAAMLTYLVIKPVYQSSGMLRVQPRDGKILYSNSDDSRLRLFDAFVTTEMQLLTSRPVLESALQHIQIGHDDSFPLPKNVGDMASMVVVTGKKGLISLAARSSDPRLSAATVNSVIAAYEDSNETARRRNYDVRRDELRSRESELGKTLKSLNAEYLKTGGEHDATTLAKAHVAKTAQLEVLEQRITDLVNTIDQLQLTGVVGADVGNNVEIQRATLLDQAMAEMTYERAQRLAVLETLKGRYRPSHPKLRSAQGELRVLEAAIAERRDQIAMLGKAGALTGNNSGSNEESLDDLQMVRSKLISRRQTVREEAADLNGKLIRIRGIETEKERLEELLAETKRALDEVLVESHNDLSGAIELVALGRVPDGPIEDKRKPLALGAGVFGSLGVLALVIASGLVAGRVRFSDDLDEAGRDVLAAVIAKDANDSVSYAEAARKVRNEFDLRWPLQQGTPLVLGIVGTAEGDGATSMTRALGTHYAGRGRKVLLVDANNSNSALSHLSDAPEAAGAAAVARGDITLAESVVDINESGQIVSLLPSRHESAAEDIAAKPAEMALDDMRALLEVARAEYDLIILDLGALKPGGQSAVGSALADRTVLVAACGGLRREISEARELLERLTGSRYLLTLNQATRLDPALTTTVLERVAAQHMEREPLKDRSDY